MRTPYDARCPFCKHPGIALNGKAPDGRPEFTCQKCKRTWTAGYSGGAFADWLRSRGIEVPTKTD